MTTSLVGMNWPHRQVDEPLALYRHPDRMPVGAVRIAQLQGVVMAVHGVSASAALRELQWHSAQLNTSVADLAEVVMRSVGGRSTAMTAGVLGALLAGLPPPLPERGADPDRRHPAPPLASALHLVAAHRPRPLPDAERWTWEQEGLSRRESQVLQLIGEGLSNQNIAATMFVTVNTVKSYVRAAYRKIGVTTRSQAVRWALTHEERG
ncbi:MAG: LuxR C-terminal-related transcriptional regulator [Terracoccus sp.]